MCADTKHIIFKLFCSEIECDFLKETVYDQRFWEIVNSSRAWDLEEIMPG